MTRRLPLLAALLATLPGAALAQDLSGTWTAKDVTITLTQSSDQIEGTIATDRKRIEIAGVVDGNEASGEVTGPNGTAPFTMTLAGQAMKLQMTGPDGKALTFFLKRAKAGAAPAPAPPAPAEPAATPAPSAPVKGAAGGQWKSDTEGWSLSSPPGWKGGEQKDGSVMLGHDSEWGVLRISHELGAKLEDVRARGENGFTLEGVMFAPTAPLAPLRVKAGPAVEGDYQGQSAQGPMRVHTVALQGPVGVLVISGIAVASGFGKLAQHTQAMAASVSFFKGKVGDAARHVAGTWWHWHGSSSYSSGSTGTSSSFSSEKKLWLCPDGRFSRWGESSVDVTARSEAATTSAARASNNNANGRWIAIGTPQAGKIIVTFDDGSRQELPYQAGAQGDKWQLYVDGTGYLYSKDLGGCN